MTKPLKAGFTAFNEEVFIVCAGNRPEQSSVSNLLPTPLIGRVLVIDTDCPTIDEWGQFMNNVYGDDWEKKTLAFLKRFEDEGYILKPPKTGETLDAWAQPRTWTSLAVMMAKGMTDKNTMVGLIGSEIGLKLEAFMKVDINVEELIQVPSGFHSLEFDGKYMLAVMLATWLSKHIKNVSKALDLIDTMFKSKHEYIILTAMCMNKFNVVALLKQLFAHDPNYKEVLTEIAVGLKDQIAA